MTLRTLTTRTNRGAVMAMEPHHIAATPGSPYPGEAPRPALGADTAAWTVALPVLAGPQCTLRELRIEDAPSLFAQLTTEEVARFVSPPPSSVEGIEEFIRAAHWQRATGRSVCFGVVPAGHRVAIGVFQIGMPDPDRPVAEWGFALGSAYWGSGLFLAGARRVIDFAFTQMRVQRIEARSVLANGRGNGALRKIGAVREAVLRGSFERHGERLDQALWAIVRSDWWAGLADRCWTVH